MTGTNHALTGAVIAGAIGNPILALPLAFASHFVLDSLPHFGEDVHPLSKFTKKVWFIDFVLLSSLMLFLVVTQNWLLFAGAFVAISPDFAWIYRFVFKESLGKIKPAPMNRFNSFHSGIQKYETKLGIITDVVWLGFMITIAYLIIL